MSTEANLIDRISQIRERIAVAIERSGRTPDDVKLIAVSKSKSAEIIQKSIEAGITHLGESRIQEAKTKLLELGETADDVTWHLIGHLQTNKVKSAIEIFDLIHSVDSLKLLRKIDRYSANINRKTELLLQVNTSGEAGKFGISPNRLLEFVENTFEYSNIRIRGLMTIGKFSPDAELSRPSFSLLRSLKEKIERQNYPPTIDLKFLSMGMSNDFEVAIEEGSNMVRIGKFIFGER